MAKQSFKQHEEKHPETEVGGGVAVLERSAETVAPATETSVGFLGGGGGHDTEGEVDRGDVNFPRVNVVQKVGKLNENFKPGEVTLGKEVVIAGVKSSTNIIVLKIAKSYQEDVDFDGDVNARVFKTTAEVREAGGTTDYDQAQEDDGPIYFKPRADIMLLVEAPEGISESDRESYFSYEADGKAYAIAMWTVTGSGYTGAAKPIFSSKMLNPGLPIYSRQFALSSVLKSNTKFSWYAPALKSAGKTSPEFQDFCKGMLG